MKTIIFLLLILTIASQAFGQNFKIIIEQKQANGTYIAIKAISEKGKDVPVNLLTKDSKTKKYTWPTAAQLKAAEDAAKAKTK